ncbi:hypothetical protein [uncultured Jannaschia sp.]|uniref:hypothetical protein n=1 Tax=uncultured Jannaschia sp. TaxID=293347 RepID=UPI00260D68A1|nr:hypothetical protein [uncultured Jannaschia sp.]
MRVELPAWSRMAGALAPGDYVDCFARDTGGEVPLARFVRAFFGSRMFAPEGAILRAVLGKSGDLEAFALGETNCFAAWTVADRDTRQLWLADVAGATQTWLAVAPELGKTRLFLASRVVARSGTLGWPTRALIPAHRAYSRALLGAAVRGLR